MFEIDLIVQASRSSEVRLIACVVLLEFGGGGNVEVFLVESYGVQSAVCRSGEEAASHMSRGWKLGQMFNIGGFWDYICKMCAGAITVLSQNRYGQYPKASIWVSEHDSSSSSEALGENIGTDTHIGIFAIKTTLV